jgi:benzoate/toluate 1,2-dioxygenase subunit beta
MSAPTPGEALARADAEALLFLEARLLDDGLLEEWLGLFTDDCRYWMPCLVEDPATEPSLVHEDRTGMEERVYRLTQTPAHAQTPPSRTVHSVTNVEVLDPTGDEAVVRCNVVVHEQRPGDPGQVGLGAARSIACRCEYRLLRVHRSWRIASKKVDLLERDLPLYNLTFLI